jgi:stage V sporulation protein SpoVS
MTGVSRAANEVLKVAATSKPVLVAGAIAGVIRTQSRVEIHAIGAAAVNQAIKASLSPAVTSRQRAST